MPIPARFSIRPTNKADEARARELMRLHWAGETIVTRGAVHHPHLLPGFVAEDPEGALVGLATFAVADGECELVTLDALSQGIGIGTALLRAVEGEARKRGCRRLWLVTTNDNIDALAFYQKRGLHLVAVHRDAIVRSRELKPEIPLLAPNGIPIRDEIELELLFDGAP